MRSKPATRENSRPTRAAMLAALTMALSALSAVPPAGAQTANSKSGDVGSAASSNGYPSGGGAIVLPSLGSSATPAGTTLATGAATTTSGGAASGSGGSGGGGRTGTSSAGGAAFPSGSGGGAHWVLCPPTGSSGFSPLFTGTDLSCTPE
jgi:hypothetical protein